LIQLDSNQIFNNNEKKKIIIANNDNLQGKIKRLNDEVNILNSIQKDLGKEYKIYLKDSINNELEQLNLLINKLSEYENPLIKEKLVDIIMRNKEVFNYINENILMPHIPKFLIKNYNLYPFNKSSSIYVDKYILIGKKIFEFLSIPNIQNYSNIMENVKKFGQKFLETLSKSINNNEADEEKNENKKNENENKKNENEIKSENNELFKFEISDYHLALFAFMATSKMDDKEYFNRIGALITTKVKFEDLKDKLSDIENINVSFNGDSIKEGEDDGGTIILLDYQNINKKTISFLLQKKYEQKKEKKK
jgi:hypothetical protein